MVVLESYNNALNIIWLKLFILFVDSSLTLYSIYFGEFWICLIFIQLLFEHVKAQRSTRTKPSFIICLYMLPYACLRCFFNKKKVLFGSKNTIKFICQIFFFNQSNMYNIYWVNLVAPEVYKKHHPPQLEDEVWRLEKIGKDGAFHRKLAAEGINTVQDFLKLSVVDPIKLKNVCN